MANQLTPHAANPSAGGVFQVFSVGEARGCWCLRKYWLSVPNCHSEHGVAYFPAAHRAKSIE